MALNLDAVGEKIGPISKEYTWKDAVLYALGVGAGFSDLHYCYEKDLKVIPSFAITTLYESMPQALSLTNINLAGILHGEQELVFHNPIPPDGTMTIEGKITDIYDKGKDKGALIIAESDLIVLASQYFTFMTVNTNYQRHAPINSDSRSAERYTRSPESQYQFLTVYLLLL